MSGAEVRDMLAVLRDLGCASTIAIVVWLLIRRP